MKKIQFVKYQLTNKKHNFYNHDLVSLQTAYIIALITILGGNYEAKQDYKRVAGSSNDFYYDRKCTGSRYK
jgi:hypothetical protein